MRGSWAERYLCDLGAWGWGEGVKGWGQGAVDGWAEPEQPGARGVGGWAASSFDFADAQGHYLPLSPGKVAK